MSEPTVGTVDDETTTTETPVEDGTFTQPVSLQVSEGAQYPLKPTFDDARGVERVAGPAIEQWTPAPVDPSDEELAAHEDFLAREDEQRQVRLAALGQAPAPVEANVPPRSALDQTEQGTKTPEAADEDAHPEPAVSETTPTEAYSPYVGQHDTATGTGDTSVSPEDEHTQE